MYSRSEPLESCWRSETDHSTTLTWPSRWILAPLSLRSFTTSLKDPLIASYAHPACCQRCTRHLLARLPNTTKTSKAVLLKRSSASMRAPFCSSHWQTEYEPSAAARCLHSATAEKTTQRDQPLGAGKEFTYNGVRLS